MERAIEEAQTLVPRPKFILFCAFTFDPEAAKDIDELNWPGVTLSEGADEHRPSDRGSEEGAVVEPELLADGPARRGTAQARATAGRSRSTASTISTRAPASSSRAARRRSPCGRSTPTTTTAR